MECLLQLGMFALNREENFDVMAITSYHKNFNLKQNLFNLENFNPRNFPAIWYAMKSLALVS